eukprot:gene7243-7313_t
MPEGLPEKKANKQNLHPRNAHRELYDFEKLARFSSPLKRFLITNRDKTLSIDFADPEAVLALNRALLKFFYKIDHWKIPEGYLCPAIPARADYIHYVADLLAGSNNGHIPRGNDINVLDIGTGANCVYPLIGNSMYKWSFTCTDVDPAAIQSAEEIIKKNDLSAQIGLRIQPDKASIFKGIIKPGERFDLTVCNPPFHSSEQMARESNIRKFQHLKRDEDLVPLLNFGGKNTELCCPGGEAAFINRMVEESKTFAENVLWFSTLISKKETLKGMYKSLDYFKATQIKTIEMAQGQKASRVVAWTFLPEHEQTIWKNKNTAGNTEV